VAVMGLAIILLPVAVQGSGGPKSKPRTETEQVSEGAPANRPAVPPGKPSRVQDAGTPAEQKPDSGEDGPAAPVPCSLKHAEFSQIEPVAGENGCGIPAPVRVRSFGLAENRIGLSRPATLSCEFSKTLGEWMREDLNRLAKAHLDTTVGTLVTGPGYVCRRRNNLPDGKLSEHALGTAIDITAFQTADGRTVTIEDDWGTDTPEGRFLSGVHASACARFTTVLGPAADPHHKSHFHLDIGCHGQTCTYLICQ